MLCSIWSTLLGFVFWLYTRRMSIALYRKYRPDKFQSVLGQDHIISVLSGQIEKDGVSHAYLFSGSRGTGKTSIARLLAKEIGTTENDLYEIDAASNRGIDDIRELREAVNIPPFESPRKVYIIDEVHMLTKEAFNALLKTLEEPPVHAMFILATTEAVKLPDTIVSRCEVHEFRKPSKQILREYVLDVAKKEGYKLERSSAELIALLGDGSFRDTLGILQKIISASKDKKIDPDEVVRVTGAPPSELVNDFLSAIVEKKVEKGFKVLNEALEKNISMKTFVKLVLEKVRMILFIRHAKDLVEKMEEDFSEHDFKFLTEIAGNKDSNINSKTIISLIDAYSQIGYSAVPELPIELALIELVEDK